MEIARGRRNHIYGWDANGKFFWRAPTVEVFHGTLEAEIDAIQRGVSVRRGFPFTDFGRGFYTTSLEAQARRWATQRVDTAGGCGAIIRFEIDTEALEQFSVLDLAHADGEFWEIVDRYRVDQDREPHGYDIVVGLVAKSWGRSRVVHPVMDQISFHTADVVRLLDASKQTIILL